MGLPPSDGPSAWQSINPQGSQNGAQSPHNASKERSDVWEDHLRPQNRTEVQSLPQPGRVAENEGAGSGPADMVASCTSFSTPVPEDPRDKTPMGLFVNSPLFQNLTLFIIVLNGIWIGLDVEYNHPSLKKNGVLPLEPTSLIIEHAFCVYFTVEIFMRIVAFGTRNVRDGWFLFDFLLVTFMIIETWILVIIEAIFGGEGGGLLSKFSTLRLLRLTRLSRLMHSMPELLTLVRGMLNAARAVGAVLLFMVLLMYIFAIVFTAQIGDVNAPERKLDPYWVRDTDPTSVELFGSMGDSMMTLFTRGLLGDNLAETLQAIKDRGGPWECEVEGDLDTCGREGGHLWLMWVFILFMIISAFCILNMLVGILCEVIDGTAKEEEERSHVVHLTSSICNVFRSIDLSGDEHITVDEWKVMRLNESVRSAFVGIGVEEDFLDLRLDQMEEHLFGRLDKHKLLDKEKSWIPDGPERDDAKGVPLEEFVNHILEIRPDVAASYLDLEVLLTRAERDEQAFDAECDVIEARLLARRNMIEQFSEGCPSTPRANLTAVEATTTVEAISEAPKNGTSSTTASWLQGLSSPLLFEVLRQRATVQSGSSVAAIDLD